jgi:hypothetical protein
MDSSSYVLRVVMKTVVLTLKSRINEALILCDILRVPWSPQSDDATSLKVAQGNRSCVSLGFALPVTPQFTVSVDLRSAPGEIGAGGGSDNVDVALFG